MSDWKADWRWSNTWVELKLAARERFAKANGWKTGKYFSLDLLSRNKAHYGRRFYDQFSGSHAMRCDHPEYFKVGRKPAAILAHNYKHDVQGLMDLVFSTRELCLHRPPQGKAASWYFPGGTLPMLVTRNEIDAVIWPTDEEVAEYTAAYKAMDQRRTEAINVRKERDRKAAEAKLPSLLELLS